MVRSPCAIWVADVLHAGRGSHLHEINQLRCLGKPRGAEGYNDDCAAHTEILRETVI
jgi:hypothetical protein